MMMMMMMKKNVETDRKPPKIRFDGDRKNCNIKTLDDLLLCADSWIDDLYESKNCHEIIFNGIADEKDISALTFF